MQQAILTETRYAGCKINLSLHITGVRDDGYHTLDSIFWPVTNPRDTLTFTNTGHEAFSISCNVKGIDTKNNTLTKAYAAFIRAGGTLNPAWNKVHVELKKGIPHGAGLGGGSSDAAAVLLWCNDHAEQALSAENLHKAAVSVGADVPFFLLNKPARVQGIGEIMEELPQPWPQGYIILLCPNVYISTPWAYKKFDEEKSTFFSKKLLTKSPLAYRTLFTGAGHENTNDAVESELRRKVELENETTMNQELRNDFESVVFKAHPKLEKLKQGLLDNGALMATMSGSGSSIAGIVRTHDEAQRMASKFSNAQCKVYIAPL